MAVPILLLVWQRFFRIWVFWLQRSHSLKVGVIPFFGYDNDKVTHVHQYQKSQLSFTETFNNENAWALMQLPQHAFCSPFARLTSFGDVTGHSDVMPWRYVTLWSHTVMSNTIHRDFVSGQPNQKTLEITFFGLVTLAFDLWPWLLNLADIWSRSTLILIFGSIRQTVQPGQRSQTDRRKHRNTGPILLPRPLMRQVMNRLAVGSVWQRRYPLGQNYMK